MITEKDYLNLKEMWDYQRMLEYNKELLRTRIKSLLNEVMFTDATEEDMFDTIKYLKQHKISFANQVYNEPEAIRTYLRSCLQFAGIVDEVYVIDHRSSDNTLEVIKSFEKVNNIKLPYEIVGRREGDIEKIYSDTNLSRNELNWKAERNLDEMMKSAWKWEKTLKDLGL